MQEDDKDSGWKYTGGQPSAVAQPASSAPAAAPATNQAVTWTASEYVAHDKTAGWFVRFTLVSVTAIAVIYLLTQELMSVILLSVLAVVFGVFAARQPQELQYRLDNQGITIGSKFYPISLFRSFAIVEEGAFHSIMLLPMKRFMPPISLYFSPDNEQAIMENFGNLLPQEERQQDPLDKFMHRIRF